MMEKNLTKFHLSVDFLFLFQSKKKKRSLNIDLSDFIKDYAGRVGLIRVSS
jgi:hypothetical protein